MILVQFVLDAMLKAEAVVVSRWNPNRFSLWLTFCRSAPRLSKSLNDYQSRALIKRMRAVFYNQKAIFSLEELSKRGAFLQSPVNKRKDPEFVIVIKHIAISFRPVRWCPANHVTIHPVTCISLKTPSCIQSTSYSTWTKIAVTKFIIHGIPGRNETTTTACNSV
jgi:hypothetical protein